MPELTEHRAICAIWHRYGPKSDIMVPRYTPLGWWECDVWRLTKAGYVDEYEIKLTASDFRADAKKDRRGMTYNQETRKWERQEANKHQLLVGDTHGPNRFWFVLPAELVVDVPAWAGVLRLHQHGRWTHITEERRAPKRHNRKWTGDRAQILKTFYWRFWNHSTK